MRKIVVSGMRPTGKLHLGNYWGAVSNWIKLQNEYECYFFIADLHSLTTSIDLDNYYENSFLMVVDWLSSGVDPDKCVIFRQSDISSHCELHVILSMITPISWLLRNPTFKETLVELYKRKYSGQEDKARKSTGHLENLVNISGMSDEESKAINCEYANYGFLGYPVLQSADILLYDADFVPVGKDQLPHIELTRQIARRFNHIFKTDLLKEPQPLLTQIPLLPGIDGKKMSKSYGNTIEIGENGDELREKVMSMFTDPNKKRLNDKGNPYGCVVFAFHRIYSSDYCDIESNCKDGKIGCVNCKKHLFENLDLVMKEMNEKKRYYLNNKEKVLEIIERGNEKARKTAAFKMERIYREIKIKWT